MTYEQIKQMLLLTTDPVERLELVMDFGAHIGIVPDGANCSEITGCASRVQICRMDNNFYGTADSVLVRGIVAILTAMVDGKTPEQIRKMDLKSEFLSLNLNLGAGRINGVNSMIRFLQNL
ncbi:MAG: SufE family protein [Alphaproteobacteria bacterium]|nr:SufE family protein [Alphaproteobacteria bacterium]